MASDMTPLTRRRLLTIPSLAALTGALGACDALPLMEARAIPYQVEVEHRNVELPQIPDLSAAVTACAALGERMVRHQVAEGGLNAMACPVGLSLGLALLFAGATTPTIDVDRVLGTAADDGSVADGTIRDLTWSGVMTSLQEMEASERALKDFDPEKLPDTPMLHIANRVLLLVENRVTLPYLEAANRWYSATIEHCDRRSAKKVLDAWSRHHTGGLIKKSGILVEEDTVAVLQNALLLAAAWQTPFSGDATTDEEFTRSDGTKTQVPMMSEGLWVPQAQANGWRAIRLPYASHSQDPRLVVDIILPDAGTDPSELPEGSWAAASTALNSAPSTEITLTMPRFDLSTGPVDMASVLMEMGLDITAPLPHIGDDLQIGQAVQQVRLMVAEKGTVAAALTEIEIQETAGPVEKDMFTVDHPFVLRIVDRTTGLGVIEGLIGDPGATS